MRINIVGFTGLHPSIDGRLLRPNEATVAYDTKLVNGTISAWKSPLSILTLPKVGTIKSVYRFGQNESPTQEAQYWMHWTTDVDVVRGPVPDLTSVTERTYWTGDASWPRYSYSPQIVTKDTEPQDGNYPQVSYRLGIPAPTSAPTVVAGAVPAGEAVETAKNVDITSIHANSATVALVTLPTATDFTITEPTKVTVTGALPDTFNGTYDVTWLTTTTFTYAVPDVSANGLLGSEYVEVTSLSRYDANTIQVNLANAHTFLTTKAAKITVAGCNISSVNGVFDVIWVSAAVIRFKPVKPNQSITLPAADFTLSRVDSTTAQIVLNNGATTFDQNQTVRVVISNVADPTCLNGSFDGTWINSTTIQFKPLSAIPAVTITGQATAPFMSLTLTGSTVVDIPASPAPSGVSLVMITGYQSGQLPTGSNATGVTQVYLSGTAPPAEDSRVKEQRNYVVTYVSPLGEEGPPSPASAILSVIDGQEVTLSNLPTAPGGSYNLPTSAKIRIYRSATSGNAAVYLFAAEQLISAGTTWVDTLKASALAEALPSEYWNPPQDDFKGLCLLANGSMAAFRENEVWFSEPNLPHAWPSRNMSALGDRIVGIAAFGSNLFVGTVGRPYILTGIDPAQMMPNRITVEQSCVSKKSIVPVNGGVLYASPDGICIADASGVQVLTEKLMSRDDWQAYNPSSIVAGQHDGRYYACYTKEGGLKGTLVLDLTGAGAALWEMSHNYTALFSDVEKDALYGVDANRVLWRVNGHATDTDIYSWYSKLFEAQNPSNFSCARVLANEYPDAPQDPISFLLWHGDTPDEVDASTPFSQAVLDDKPFRLPSGFRSRYWRIGVSGTPTIYAVTIANSVQELYGG